MKRFCSIVWLILLCVTLCTPVGAEPQQEAQVIFVSGNPNLYPIEYYDAAEKTYQGLLPALLQEFSAQGAYKIEYLESGPKDERFQKYKNRQAELVSGCSLADGFDASAWQAGIPVFLSEQDGVPVEYRILFTQLADEQLRQALSTFFSSLPPAHQNELLLAEIAPQTPWILPWALVGTGLLALILTALLIIFVYRCRRQTKSMRAKAETDQVTGIGNLDYIKRYFKQVINDKNRVLYSLIFFYLDTDRIRRLESNEEANNFLRHTALILSEYTKDTDILARVSDGGFALLRLSTGPNDVKQWIRPVLERIREYGKKYGKLFLTEAYGGIYYLKPSDHDLSAMVFKAEQSCYYARSNGWDYAECSQEVISKYQEESSLQKRTTFALQKEEFTLYLHFFVDTTTQKIVGAEALSRWMHPEKGLLMPSRYIPLMEREKTVSQLDFYVLERVCRFLQELCQKQACDFFISCNFSRNTFAAADFVSTCISIIEQYQFPREELILELTESGSVPDTDAVYQNALQMKQYGVSIALDDFGDGYTSFSDLQTYHFDGLKIDKSLIEKVETAEGEIILKGLVEIGHSLGLTVLAEGVENDQQVQRLAKMGCDVIQGFYFYKPLPLKEAEKIYLKQQKPEGI